MSRIATRGYKELTAEQQNMVSVLTHYITACEYGKEPQAAEFDMDDVSKMFKVKRTSLAALKSNITRVMRRGDIEN